MKFVTIFILGSLLSISNYSQNLIINGDFENYDTLPDFNGQIERAIPWINNSGSCDFWYNMIWKPWFDTTISAKSGSGFSSIGNSSNGLGSEFFGQQISTSLITGKTYLIGAYIRNGNNTIWNDTCSKLSFYGFPSDPLIDSIWIRPSDFSNNYLLCDAGSSGSLNWQLHTCSFTAPANLNYIAVTLNGDCNQLVFIDSIFCIETNKQILDSNACNYYIPNAFSPNGDGKNDFFKPIIKCDFNEYSLKIFNRWGELVYHSVNINNAWNGHYKNKECEIGTYYYFLTYKHNNKQRQVVKGDLVLIK